MRSTRAVCEIHMTEQDLVNIGIWAALIFVPLAFAMLQWRKGHRTRGVFILAASWLAVAFLMAGLIWKGHTIRSHRRQHFEQQRSQPSDTTAATSQP